MYLKVDLLVKPHNIIIIIIIILSCPCLPLRSGRSRPVCSGGGHGWYGGGVCEEEAAEVCSEREDPDLPDGHGEGVPQEHDEETRRGSGGEKRLYQD